MLMKASGNCTPRLGATGLKYGVFMNGLDMEGMSIRSFFKLFYGFLLMLPDDTPNVDHLLRMASTLRDSAQLFQSDEMRPANDPKERAPIRVRMLNDVLQSLEKNFLVPQVPPGFYR